MIVSNTPELGFPLVRNDGVIGPVYSLKEEGVIFVYINTFLSKTKKV